MKKAFYVVLSFAFCLAGCGAKSQMATYQQIDVKVRSCRGNYREEKAD